MSSMPNVTPAWPVEIRLLKDRRALHVTFEDGNTFTLSAELLRVTSPSAEVQGHSEAQRKTVGGKRNVTILSVDAVGNYAVRLGFDDMHTTGIYSWAFLRDLGQNAERRFQDYVDDLPAKGLGRDWPGDRRRNPESAARRFVRDRAETPKNRYRSCACRRSRAAPRNCRPHRRREWSRYACRRPSCVALRNVPALRRRGWSPAAIPRRG